MQNNDYNNKNVECIVYIDDHTFSRTVSKRDGYEIEQGAIDRPDMFIIYVHEHVAKTKEFDRFVRNRIKDLAVTSTAEDIKIVTMEAGSYNDVLQSILEMKTVCTTENNRLKNENKYLKDCLGNGGFWSFIKHRYFTKRIYK